MADPLSIAASAAGLLSLGLQSAEYLYNYYTSYKDRDSDLARTTNRLGDLIQTLESIDQALRTRKWQPDETTILRNIETQISRCEDVIKELQDEVQKFQKDPTSNPSSSQKPTANLVRAAKAIGRKAAYPLRRSTLEKLDEDVSELRDNLSTVLQALQLKQSQDTHNEIEEIKRLIEHAQALSLRSAVRDWLKAPDATIDYSVACNKRYAGTGEWFVKGDTFKRWLEQESSFLWLYGFAGCGKSVLCSTAIQYTFRHRQSQRGIAVAFFFFTFNDESKRDVSAMLRALLLQLAGQVPGVEDDLTRLKASCNDGRPSASIMLDYLHRVILRSPHVYILLDALDECPIDQTRMDVLSAIEVIRGWSSPSLHLLVTSRNELDIRQSLDTEEQYMVVLRNDEVKQDISNYVSHMVDYDRQLRRWGDHRDEIKQCLTERADGVFRWVECQLGPLRKCPQSLKHLRRCLDSLPKSLDATYERMLCEIPEEVKEEAQRILTLLCFAYRPLSVSEVISALAVDISDTECYDHDRKLEQPEDLLRICPGLIDIVSSQPPKVRGSRCDRKHCYLHDEDTRIFATVRIAHFSVQEYLLSARIPHPLAAFFGTDKKEGHFQISKTCLIYLCNEDFWSQPYCSGEYPLSKYAAKYWYHHFFEVGVDRSAELEISILRLLSNEDILRRWRRLHSVITLLYRWYSAEEEVEVRSPVFEAALLGLYNVLVELLAVSPQDVNAWGRLYSTLQAAVARGNVEVVRLLLDCGADVNLRKEEQCTALYLAVNAARSEQLVELLLDRGADINAYSGDEYATTLHQAIDTASERVVELLLDRGADIGDATWLDLAARRGREGIVKLLLDRGANINACTADKETALAEAVRGGHEGTVGLLLDRGADVGILAEHVYPALTSAADSGFERTIKLLLDRGADVDPQGPSRNSALKAAIRRKHSHIAELLLDYGADITLLEEPEYSIALEMTEKRRKHSILLQEVN